MAADSLRTWPLAEWLSVGSALESIELFQAGSGQPVLSDLRAPARTERGFPPRRPLCGLHLRDS